VQRYLFLPDAHGKENRAYELCLGFGSLLVHDRYHAIDVIDIATCFFLRYEFSSTTGKQTSQPRPVLYKSFQGALDRRIADSVHAQEGKE